MYEEEEDTSYWQDPNPKHHRGEHILCSGSTGDMQCPECGSYNTMQTVYVEKCNSCGWSQGY